MAAPFAILPKILDVAASQSDISLVPASTLGRRFRVVALVATADTVATTVLFKSAATGITTALDVSAGAPLVLPGFIEGWFQTNANEALTVSTGAGGVSLLVRYAEI